MSNFIYKATESVSAGHPDKVADIIAGSLVDAFITKDNKSRCGIEVMVKDNIVVLGGEVYSSAEINYDKAVKSVFDDIIYPESHHLNPENIKVINLIGKQSPEIHQAVDISDTEIGGSDQGFMTGFACDDTETCIPLGTYITRKICEYIAFGEYSGIIGPDAKSQVVIAYRDDRPVAIDSILISSMHQNPFEDMQKLLLDAVFENRVGFDNDIFDEYIKGHPVKLSINPAGEWRIGGSISDCGMCNRKLVVDQYGSASFISGGGLHGKDNSKLDFSANMICRGLAKDIVKNGIAKQARVNLSYSIGVVEPTSFSIELSDNKQYEAELVEYFNKVAPLRPYDIMNFIGYAPKHRFLAQYGFFELNDDDGSDWNFFERPWEFMNYCNSFKR